MTEYYSDIVASSLVSEIRFSTPGILFGTSKLQLEVDYRDGILDPVLVSSGTTLKAILRIDQYNQAPDLSDITLEYQDDEGGWIDASTLTNPGISITSVELSGSSSSIGEAGFAFPTYDYMVTFTLDSALTSSESSQNWINSIIERNFKLKISENFINQVSNAGYDVSLPLSTFNLFTTDFGTPPPPTILSQPQNTNHGLAGSSFTVSFRFYGTMQNLSVETWQYSDNYDENNLELATWNDITSENSIGAMEALEFSWGDLQYLVKTTGSGPMPDLFEGSSTLTVNSWAANRKYRYKYVVV